MLTLPEKLIFILVALATIIAVFFAVRRIVKIIARGHGKPDWSIIPKRLLDVLVKNFNIMPISTPDEDLKAILG